MRRGKRKRSRTDEKGEIRRKERRRDTRRDNA